MKLYTYFRSTAAYRVRIALNLKAVAYEPVPTHLLRDGGEHRRASFLSLNPQGLVPVLQDGETVIAQSLAILEYLEETHPEPPLLPTSPADRACVRSMALSIACDIHPLNNLRVLTFLRSSLGQGEDAVNRWYAHWIAEGLGGLEGQARTTSGDGRHMFGSSVTLADVCIVPQMFNARRFNCDISPYPTLRGICEHLEQLPPFAAAVPELQPDAQ